MFELHFQRLCNGPFQLLDLSRIIIFVVVQCSQTCRSGTRMRDVLCLGARQEVVVGDDEVNRTRTVFDVELEMGFCRNYSRQMEPDAIEECNSHIPCPVRFLPGAYGEVSLISAVPPHLSELWVPSKAVAYHRGGGLPEILNHPTCCSS